MTPIPRNKDYYLDDRLVVLAVRLRHLSRIFSQLPSAESCDRCLKVDNELFRVHRSILARESDVFASMFELPQAASPTIVVDGSDDDHPISIPVTTKSEFKAFLDYVYSMYAAQTAACLTSHLLH
jgi:hypothetical protein